MTGQDANQARQQFNDQLLRTTPEQAANSSIRNLVTRALGVEEVTLLEVNEYTVELGDIYLMCSDGLSDMVDDAEIAKILVSDGPMDLKAERLVDAANEHGGRDNITVLMVQAAMGGEKRGLISRLLGK